MSKTHLERGAKRRWPLGEPSSFPLDRRHQTLPIPSASASCPSARYISSTLPLYTKIMWPFASSTPAAPSSSLYPVSDASTPVLSPQIPQYPSSRLLNLNAHFWLFLSSTPTCHIHRSLQIAPNCHPTACRIQTCLKNNASDSTKCSREIMDLYECCMTMYDIRGDKEGVKGAESCPNLVRLLSRAVFVFGRVRDGGAVAEVKAIKIPEDRAGLGRSPILLWT